MSSLKQLLRSVLAHPITHGLDLDDADTICAHAHLIQKKPFLRAIYEDWYRSIARSLRPANGPVLELGSGGGFLSEWVEDVILSDIHFHPDLQLVLDGQRFPFPSDSLGGVVMVNVLHHIANPRRFFDQATRCVLDGGTIVMIEPWNTAWSHWVYARFHHESFDPQASDWDFPSRGRLSDANGALPWILFERDWPVFTEAFPVWRIETITPIMPFRYLLSGGVSMRALVPAFSYPVWRNLEAYLQPWSDRLAMFAHIVLKKN